MLFRSISRRGDPSGTARSIDLALVAIDDVRPWRSVPRLDLQVGEWLRPAFERGDETPWDPLDPDLVIGIAMVRASGRALLGPPPDRLLDPVPWSDLRRALLGTIPDLRSHLAGDERNVILTFARIRATLETGRFLAKDAAAAWAIERTDDSADRAVLARARSLYLDGIAAQHWGELRPADRKSTRLNSSHIPLSRMPSSA